MAIYAYKCDQCHEVFERLVRGYRAPKTHVHACPAHNGHRMGAVRYLAGEVPVAHTQGDYHFSPHFDLGAGRSFASNAEYKAWQRANTDADGAMPEPVAGRRKVAMYEEAAHACEVNQQVQIDEKAQRQALGKAYDAAHRELAACQAMGVKAPSLDD